MSNKKLLDDNIVNFFSKKKEYNSLSNFWINDITIIEDHDKRIYESGEHCFHEEKYILISNLIINDNRKEELLEYRKKFLKPSIYNTGNKVKKMGGKKDYY